MKVLFVCRRNTGRSQVAEELYNQLTGSKDAESAGIEVDFEGQKLKDRPPASIVISVLEGHGIDMSENTRTKITKEVAEKYDKVVVMAAPELTPGWIRQLKSFEQWEVEDIKRKNMADTKRIVHIIRKKVEDFIKINK